jgi:HEAT repeat protein
MAPEDEAEALAWLAHGGVRRQNAAEWFKAQWVDPQRRAEVAAALEIALDDPADDAATWTAVASALARWAERENVPALLKTLDDEINDDVVDALIRLRDKRGPVALAKQLESDNVDDASAALLRMHGEGIDVEDAVADFMLATPEVDAKVDAIQLLAKVGTRTSIPKIEKAMRENVELKDEGEKVIQAIKERK